MPPPPTADDLGWWRELLAWIGSGVVAITTGTWIVANRAKDIVAAQKSLSDAQCVLAERITALENTDRDMGRFCRDQRRELLEELRRDVCHVLQLALKDAKIESNRDLSTMTTTMELHTQALGEIQKDIEAIFRRLDRRHESRYTPHGRREEDLHEL